MLLLVSWRYSIQVRPNMLGISNIPHTNTLFNVFALHTLFIIIETGLSFSSTAYYGKKQTNFSTSLDAISNRNDRFACSRVRLTARMKMKFACNWNFLHSKKKCTSDCPHACGAFGEFGQNAIFSLVICA